VWDAGLERRVHKLNVPSLPASYSSITAGTVAITCNVRTSLLKGFVARSWRIGLD